MSAGIIIVISIIMFFQQSCCGDECFSGAEDGENVS